MDLSLSARELFLKIMDNSFEKLKLTVNQLKNLLDNPEFGLFTWNELVKEKIEEINNIYHSKD